MKGATIGNRGEVLLGDGETITSVRYTVLVARTTGVEFSTSSGRTFGPFGFDDGDEIAVNVSLFFYSKCIFGSPRSLTMFFGLSDRLHLVTYVDICR